MTHKHDLMHKAVGWMLREVGKEIGIPSPTFTERYATQLPRTALRYAIEHYPGRPAPVFLKDEVRDGRTTESEFEGMGRDL